MRGAIRLGPSGCAPGRSVGDRPSKGHRHIPRALGARVPDAILRILDGLGGRRLPWRDATAAVLRVFPLGKCSGQGRCGKLAAQEPRQVEVGHRAVGGRPEAEGAPLNLKVQRDTRPIPLIRPRDRKSPDQILERAQGRVIQGVDIDHVGHGDSPMPLVVAWGAWLTHPSGHPVG